MLEKLALETLQRPICILNSGDRTNLSFFFLLVFVPLRSDNLAFHLHRNEYFLSNQMIKINYMHLVIPSTDATT